MAEESILTESATVDPAGSAAEEQLGFLASIFQEIIYSPINLLLVGVITLVVYKMFHRQQPESSPLPEPELPRLRQDMTVAELRKYDGTQPDGRVLVAVNGSVYDVTKGKRFYGPGGPYAAFGGSDASRGLATFSVTSNEKNEYDDLSDLTQMEMESVREWEMQFREKYILVGRLLKPGEEPNNYSDEDEDSPNDASTPSATESAAPTTSAAPAATATATAQATPSSPKKDSKPRSEEAAAPSKVEEIKPEGDAKGKDEE